MDLKLRIKLLRQKIKGIALDRKILLDEQRSYRNELNRLKEEAEGEKDDETEIPM